MSFLHLDPLQLIEALGYFGIFCIVLAESGILIGFFLPGDSLLLTAGLLASQGILSLPFLLALIPIAAIAGDSIGYWFGMFVGPRIFTRDDSFFFNKAHIERARQFYERYGAKAVVLARFMPIIRTFIPILAGVGHMRYNKFLAYNAIGGFIWGIAFVLLGYFLGRAVPNIDHYILPIIAAVVIISLIPTIVEWRRSKKSGTKSS
ncbi:MAG TPA: VTT domain-containing protein [Candidatus Paceibacterota bacterium]|nr:VTT domain-containing protein [Candidatus Paceibacterota bacterium]